MEFTVKPNLPVNTKNIIIGEKYSGILREPLEKMDIGVILVPDNPDVDETLSGHADLSVIHLGGNVIALAPFLKGSGFADDLEMLGYKLLFPEIKQGKKYPADAAMNICICGDYFFFNPKTADNTIVEYLTKNRAKTGIAVKQGYSKCSVCVVDERTIISSDRGIHAGAVTAGLDSLLISPGFIELLGFDYGFIGGASFKLSDDTIAFTGHLNMHPDKDAILNYLSLHNIKVVYITEKTVFDIGSAIQIVEK